MGRDRRAHITASLALQSANAARAEGAGFTIHAYDVFSFKDTCNIVYILMQSWGRQLKPRSPSVVPLQYNT